MEVNQAEPISRPYYYYAHNEELVLTSSRIKNLIHISYEFEPGF